MNIYGVHKKNISFLENLIIFFTEQLFMLSILEIKYF